MRHTVASLFLQDGAPIIYVGRQLGHRDAAITLHVYARWLPDVSRETLVDRLDDAAPHVPQTAPSGFRCRRSRDAKCFSECGDPEFGEEEPRRRLAQAARSHQECRKRRQSRVTQIALDAGVSRLAELGSFQKVVEH
jgi:hypothetical protein